MDVYIVGAGAVGMLVASFLGQADHSVTLIVRNTEQATALSKQGLTRFNIDHTETHIPIKVATTIPYTTQPIVILVATKYNSLHTIYKNLANCPNAQLLFIQNGFNHFEEALQLPQQHITFGSAQFGAEKTNDTVVVHRGVGVLKLAIGRGDYRWIHLLEHMQSPLFLIEHHLDAKQMLFEKALLNCFINPLTAILQVQNGQLLERPHAYKLLQQLYQELTEAFPHMRSTFPFQLVSDLCEKTANNTSSMLADRLAGRMSEVDTIVGAVIRVAEQQNKELTLLKTLKYLLLAIEENGEKN